MTPKPKAWQVWYCPERDEITIWNKVKDPAPKFRAEHVPTKKLVTMIFIGEL